MEEKKKERMIFCFYMILLAAAAGFLYRDYLTGVKLFIFSDIGCDSLNQTYPKMLYLSRYFKEFHALPEWSFQAGLGTNLYSAVFTDPFNLLIAALGIKSAAYLMGLFQVLKVMAAGVLFYLYLRMAKTSPYASFVFGFAYAFCGHMIVRSSWISYPNEVVGAALLLLGFEYFFRKGKEWLLPLGFAFCFLCKGAYGTVLYSGVAAFYAVFRYCSERPLHKKEVLGFSLRYLKLYGIGFLLSAFFILPNLVISFLSPRMQEGSSSALQMMREMPMGASNWRLVQMAFLRLLHPAALGIHENYTGAENILEDPLFYCGLLVVLLLTQLFLVRDRKKKSWYIFMLSAGVLYTCLPQLRYVANGFSAFSPDMVTFKLSSFWIVIALLFIGAKVFDEVVLEKRLRPALLLLTAFILITVLFLWKGAFSVSLKNLLLICAGLVFYTGWLLLFQYGKGKKQWLFSLLFVFAAAEAVAMNEDMVNSRDVMTREEYQGRVLYNDGTYEAVKLIESLDPSPFYRVEKYYSSVYNCDALAQDYYGVKSYLGGAEQAAGYVSFMTSVKDDIELLSIIGNFNLQLELNSLTGVKYLLSKEQLELPGLEYFDSAGGIKIYRNQYALPIGFAYSEVMTYEEFEKLSLPERRIALLKGGVLPKEETEPFGELKKMEIQKVTQAFVSESPVLSYPYAEYYADINERKAEGLQVTEYREKDNYIAGDIAVNGDRLLCFTIPYESGWTLLVDQTPVELIEVNHGFLGAYVFEGPHHIELKFEPPAKTQGIYLSLAGVLLYIGNLVWVWLRKRKQKVC